MSDLPPGFTLDDPNRARRALGVPPLPEGFTLDPQPTAPTPEAPMSWGDWGRFGMTAGVRGLGNLVQGFSDPLAPLRKLASPELFAMEQTERAGANIPDPGEIAQRAGTALFNATVPEYQPTTPRGRVGMATAQGGVAGGPFGIGGAVLGALGGLLGQETQEMTGSERLSTLAGMVPGGAVAAAGARARSRTTPEYEAAGVNPTFGQAMGGPFNKIEQAIGSIPFVGEFMARGRAGATDEYVRGYINRALGHIDERLNPRIPVGREAITEADTTVGNRYDAVTPKITNFGVDPQFGAEIARIAGDLNMYPAVRNQFGGIVKDQILDKLQQPGGLTGQAYRDAESTLGQFVRDNRFSLDANQRAIGRAAQELQDALRDQLRRSNPEIADELANIHRAYRELLPMDVASAKLGTGLGGRSEAGVPSPRQLTAATREMDPRLRKGGFRQGTAVGQDYAEPGIRLLGDTLPDSGTPYRSLVGLGGLQALGAGGVAAGLLNPATLLGLGAGGLGAGLLYSPQGRAAMNYFLRRPEQAAAVGLLGANND